MAATPTDGATADPTTSASPTSNAKDGPVEAFHTWLKLSRVPDARAACAMMSAPLIKRMLSEYKQSLGGTATCEGMITETTALYKALKQSSDTDVKILKETPTKATLFVRYVGGGGCGHVVLERRPCWVITEQSEKTC